LPEALGRVAAIANRYQLEHGNVFHAGDGNLHPIISFDRRDTEEVSRVHSAGEEILRVCVEAGGVLSGEHGIGNEKREFMRLLFTKDDLDAMRRLRAAFDPDGVCNPGKVLPTPRACAESNPAVRMGSAQVPSVG
jgi:FAD/FMN-containing dehydrogenase